MNARLLIALCLVLVSSAVLATDISLTYDPAGRSREPRFGRFGYPERRGGENRHDQWAGAGAYRASALRWPESGKRRLRTFTVFAGTLRTSPSRPTLRDLDGGHVHRQSESQ